jgi:hypothetical protein
LRGGLASRGEQVGSQLGRKLSTYAAAAAVATTVSAAGVARRQKATDELTSQTAAAAAMGPAAWFTAEDSAEKRL